MIIIFESLLLNTICKNISYGCLPVKTSFMVFVCDFFFFVPFIVQKGQVCDRDQSKNKNNWPIEVSEYEEAYVKCGFTDVQKRGHDKQHVG